MSRELQAKILGAFFALATVGLIVIAVVDVYQGRATAIVDAGLLVR